MGAMTYEELRLEVLRMQSEGKLPKAPDREQIVDWVYGQVKMKNERVTKEIVAELLNGNGKMIINNSTGALREMKDPNRPRMDLVPPEEWLAIVTATSTCTSPDDIWSFLSTGAQSDLLSFCQWLISELGDEDTALREIGLLYSIGAVKYLPRNWEKGRALSGLIDSMLNHLNAHRLRKRDEAHGAAALWNAIALLYTWRRIQNGKLPVDLCDYPALSAVLGVSK